MSACAYWLTAAGCLLLARLPWLLSPNRVVDGDAAILGIMARHLARGEPAGLFFPGQSYGLSIVEAGVAAVGFLVFGESALVLELSTLFIFFAGLVVWERAFRHAGVDIAWSRGLTLVLGLLPVWIHWSMRARGGYVTAFVLSGAVVALLMEERDDPEPTRGRALLAGGLGGLLVQANPLWFPGVAPFYLLPRLRGASWRRTLLMGLAGAVVAAGVGVAGGQLDAWEPGVLLGLGGGMGLLLPERVYRMFTGFFHLGDVYPVPAVVMVVAALATAGFAGCLLSLTLRSLRKPTPLPAVTGLAMAWAIVPVIFLNRLMPRYLLQASPLLCLGIAVVIGQRIGPRAAAVDEAGSREIEGEGAPASEIAWGGGGPWYRTGAGALLVLLLAAAFQVRELRTHARDTGSDIESELADLGRSLEADGVEGAYVLDGLLQWQMAFYGGEEIPVRSRRARDRFPRLGERVDSVRRAGGRVVLVGPIRMLSTTGGVPEGLRRVGSDYFVLPDPPISLLIGLGFEFEASPRTLPP